MVRSVILIGFEKLFAWEHNHDYILDFTSSHFFMHGSTSLHIFVLENKRQVGNVARLPGQPLHTGWLLNEQARLGVLSHEPRPS